MAGQRGLVIWAGAEVGVQVGKILEAAAGAPFIESGDWERSGKA